MSYMQTVFASQNSHTTPDTSYEADEAILDSIELMDAAQEIAQAELALDELEFYENFYTTQMELLIAHEQQDHLSDIYTMTGVSVIDEHLGFDTHYTEDSFKETMSKFFDKIMKAVNAVIEFVMKVWEHIRRFWINYIEQIGRLNRAYINLIEKVKKETKTSLKESTFKKSGDFPRWIGAYSEDTTFVNADFVLDKIDDVGSELGRISTTQNLFTKIDKGMYDALIALDNYISSLPNLTKIESILNIFNKIGEVMQNIEKPNDLFDESVVTHEDKDSKYHTKYSVRFELGLRIVYKVLTVASKWGFIFTTQWNSEEAMKDHQIITSAKMVPEENIDELNTSYDDKEVTFQYLPKDKILEILSKEHGIVSSLLDVRYEPKTYIGDVKELKKYTKTVFNKTRDLVKNMSYTDSTSTGKKDDMKSQIRNMLSLISIITRSIITSYGKATYNIYKGTIKYYGGKHAAYVYKHCKDSYNNLKEA